MLTACGADSATAPDAIDVGDARISYAVATASGMRTIHTIRVDGRDDVELGGTGTATTPFYAWSPRGDRIAFSTHGAQLTVLPATGPAVIIPASGIGASLAEGAVVLDGLAWSPDGSRIAFITGMPGASGQLYTINPDGSGRLAVSAPRVYGEHAIAWLTSSTTIALSGADATGPGLWLAGSGGETRIAAERLVDLTTTIAGSTAMVLGVRAGSGLATYGSTGASGAELTTMGLDAGSYAHPHWSPDGRWIAGAHRGPSGRWELFIGDLSTHAVVHVPANTSAPFWSEWSPDGRWIVFIANVGDGTDPTRDELFVVRADGTGLRRVTTNTVGEAMPRWVP